MEVQMNPHVVNPDLLAVQPEAPAKRNLMQNIITWVRDPEVPILAKIGMAALAAFTALAAGYIFGNALFFLAVASSLCLAWAVKELASEDKTQDLRAQIIQFQVDLAFAKMKGIFGSDSDFEEIPVLDIGDREGDTGYIDFIEVAEMEDVVMRGVDKYNRPFIAMKIFQDHHVDEAMVLVLFQRYATGSEWTYACNVNLLNDRLENGDRETIRQIILGEHEQYALAPH